MTEVDEWAAFDDLISLHSADDADELRRRLVLFSDSSGSKADAFEPWCLLRKAHKDEPNGAVATALLLLTDRRWRNATGRLIRRIEESDLVPRDHLDLLAQTFLAADAHVYWEAPGDWFTGPAIAIDLDEPAADDELDNDEQAQNTSDGPVVFAREVRPPLRRWAAGRVVRAEPGSWAALVRRARELDPRSGAAVVRGLLDGIEHLPPTARAAATALALRWPQRDVREAAAELTARQDPGDASLADACAAPRKSEHAKAHPSLF